MKRLVLCALAVLLTSGALATRPAFACVADPVCDPWDCQDMCVATGHHIGTCNTCTDQCRCS
jgi:hypothetical protein